MGKRVMLFLAGLLLAGWWFWLPDPLFDEPYSTVLLDREGRVMGVTVAADEQFRFPEVSALPARYVMALMAFEDRRFLEHGGVDWLALARAVYQNVAARRVVSGASTISMQVIRLSRKNPPRTFPEKFLELLLTFRLEATCPKYRILQLYAAHAPFGGNIVGLEAAAMRYFDRSPEQLSWAEAALLAVLPNAPSLKDVKVLKGKRDRVLGKLFEQGLLGGDDYSLALSEPLPVRIYDAGSIAPHLLAKADLSRKGEFCRSYIDAGLQGRVNDVVERHCAMLSQNHIYNAAVMVVHVPTGEVRAYVGNTAARRGSRGNDVDVIASVRSSGSILKPALYALMQQNGYLLPATLVPDVPSRFGAYAPSNFNRDFQGVAPADKALSMSLNIPFVRMLKEYSYGRFYDDLKALGITSLNRPPDDYGLSLILGGAETSLWDLGNMYTGMASVLRHYGEFDGRYFKGEYSRVKLWRGEDVPPGDVNGPGLVACKAHEVPLSAASVWLTLKALREVERPEMESGWKQFASVMDLAWKTGTSFGFRDAWAVGVNADWVVGVWVGNADGEGRPGLVGVRAAAPILFEVADMLPVSGRFYEPTDELREVVVCRKSGYRASNICDVTDTVRVCEAGMRTGTCPHHRLVHLDGSGKWRVGSDCEQVYAMQVRPWFVLPPVQEWYYCRMHTDYRKLPPFRAGCRPEGGDVMEMIYPQKGVRVFIPLDFGGKPGAAVFELAHREPATEVFWHIDEQYIGSTRHIHQMEVAVGAGVHTLVLVDGNGNTLRQSFRVVGK